MTPTLGATGHTSIVKHRVEWWLPRRSAAHATKLACGYEWYSQRLFQTEKTPATTCSKGCPAIVDAECIVSLSFQAHMNKTIKLEWQVPICQVSDLGVQHVAKRNQGPKASRSLPTEANSSFPQACEWLVAFPGRRANILITPLSYVQQLCNIRIIRRTCRADACWRRQLSKWSRHEFSAKALWHILCYSQSDKSSSGSFVWSSFIACFVSHYSYRSERNLCSG